MPPYRGALDIRALPPYAFVAAVDPLGGPARRRDLRVARTEKGSVGGGSRVGTLSKSLSSSSHSSGSQSGSESSTPSSAISDFHRSHGREDPTDSEAVRQAPPQGVPVTPRSCCLARLRVAPLRTDEAGSFWVVSGLRGSSYRSRSAARGRPVGAASSARCVRWRAEVPLRRRCPAGSTPTSRRYRRRRW